MNQLIGLANSGRVVELERIAGSFARKYPLDGGSWKAWGIALQRQGKDALSALETAASLAPDDADAHRLLGIARWRSGRVDDSLASFHRALSIKPEDAEAHEVLGDALQNLRRLDEAASSYRRALTFNPDSTQILNNLGNALFDAGRPEEAVASYRRALQLQPDIAELHNNLCKALLDLRRVAEAIDSGRRAVTLNPSLAEAHDNLGNALLHADQLTEAVASYQRALSIKPDFAEAHNSLGNALRGLGRFDDALSCYRRAIALKSDFAEAHNNLGVALRLLSRPAEAEASCRRALELDTKSAAALAALGEIQADRGQFARAEELLLQAVAIEPSLAEAWISIPRLRKMKREDVRWLSEARRLLEQPLRSREVISLHYAIGKYFDDVQDYDQSFAHYRQANELTRLQGLPHDRQRLRQDTDQRIRFYDRARLDAWRQYSNYSQRPIFIVGMPRSGTSLAEQIIASHPSVFGAGELTYWHTATDKLAAGLYAGKVDSRLMRQLSDDYLQLLERRTPDAPRVVDKMPTNFMALGLIHALLPKARIIHMQRNAIDTCLSIYFQDFGSNISYANDLGDLANFYEEYLRLMRHWRTVLPQSALLEVPYEGLVAEQERWSRRMIEFLGLPWDERCLDFHRTERSVVTASKWQVRQKMNTASVERWRHYEKFVAPLLSLLRTPVN